MGGSVGQQDLDLDRFQSSDLLQRVGHLLHPELERYLVLVDHPMACSRNAERARHNVQSAGSE